VHGVSGKDTDEINVLFAVTQTLVPSVTSAFPMELRLGDHVVLTGENFLLLPEGQSVAWLDGEFLVEDPPSVKSLHGVAVPLTVSSRGRAEFEVTADRFGLYPGEFQGSITLENYRPDLASEKSEPLENVALLVLPSFIDKVTPQTVRRGQRVWVQGGGFVPTDAVGETVTLMELQGEFQTQEGKVLSLTGRNSLLLFPDDLEENHTLEVVLRVTTGVDGELTGLGMLPGKFVGTATPSLYFGGQSYSGDGIELTLTVGHQLQMVFVKYLPSFDEAFSHFGLYEMRETIKEQIVDKANAYYSDYNLRFVSQRPDDYAEYSIIELSGEDPNGVNLLGLDNTTGKDIGNLRFNDIVGGKNAETAEQGYYAYGGVFLKSFLGFSSALSDGTVSLASPRFDDIFSPFVPDLGGNPVSSEEYPNGPRVPEIEEAVRVLSNLIASTLAHEIGHSLGLAMVPGHTGEYHNLGDNENWLMDAGIHRPFEERGVIDGQGPAVFAPYNADYLDEILPKG